MRNFILILLVLISFSSCQHSDKSANNANVPKSAITNRKSVNDLLADLFLKQGCSTAWLDQRKVLETQGDSILVEYSVKYQLKGSDTLNISASFWEPLIIDCQDKLFKTASDNPKESIDSLNQQHLKEVIRNDSICIYLREPNLLREYNDPNSIYITYADKITFAQYLQIIEFGKGQTRVKYADYLITLKDMKLQILKGEKIILSKEVQPFGNKTL